MHKTTKSSKISKKDSIGECGTFRFQVKPSILVGILYLDRRRPWPSVKNPETGNEWSDDMRSSIRNILKKTRFDVEDYKGDPIVDDKTTRKAICWAKRQGIDVIVCCQPTISDGRLAPVLHQA